MAGSTATATAGAGAGFFSSTIFGIGGAFVAGLAFGVVFATGCFVGPERPKTK